MYPAMQNLRHLPTEALRRRERGASHPVLRHAANPLRPRSDQLISCRTRTLKAPEVQKEFFSLVPSKGLEPPHRCRYMDLNHARLPIPPRWQSELQCSGGPKAAVSGRPTFSIFAARYQPVKHPRGCRSPKASRTYPNFAVIEIFALSTFDTGQPFSAASAYF